MKRKILQIEDNAQNRYLATYLLESAGFEVISAEGGMEGLQMATRINPDLFLLDIQLPDCDGYEVAQRLREQTQFAEVPIVAVSSFAMPGDAARAMAAGCTVYIEKPIDPETFVQQIRTLLPSPDPLKQ